MKNVFLIVIITLLPVILAGQPEEPTVTPLKPREFREEMDRVVHVLVDVREPFEYRASRIPGAINIPSQDGLRKFADTTYVSTHIFLYCTTDPRSSKAAGILGEMGFIHIYNLEGGIAAWRKAGLPVEKRRKRF